MEDWGNLFEHALNADASVSFQDWLRLRSGWQWHLPAEQADHPEEALVGAAFHYTTMPFTVPFTVPSTVLFTVLFTVPFTVPFTTRRCLSLCLSSTLFTAPFAMNQISSVI